MKREDMVRLMAASIQDQMENPHYKIIRYGNSREAYFAAADVALKDIENKLTTPWDILYFTYCPDVRIKEVKYTGDLRRHQDESRQR